MRIAVIAPTYNEQDNIRDIASEVLKQQARLNPKHELHLVISDSHSPDKTAQISKELEEENPRIHYLDVIDRGIGVGIVKGFQYAIKQLDADILIQIDADLSHPPDVIPEMIKKIEEGYDLVIGSRYMKGGSCDYGLYRRFQSYMGNQFCRYILGVYSVSEFLTSFRAMKRQTFEHINLDKVPWQARSFVFQAAFVYELIQAGARFTEVPIRFVNRRKGRSKMATFLYIKEVTLYAIKTRIKKSKQFGKFLVVGSIGFTINAIMLILLVEVVRLPVLLNVFFPEAISYTIASALAVEVAIISNFLWNNFWTFNHNRIHRDTAIVKFAQFNLSSVGAIIIQSVVMFLGTSFVSPFLPSYGAFSKIYLLYLVIGVGIALFYNYFMYSRVIWRKHPRLATQD